MNVEEVHSSLCLTAKNRFLFCFLYLSNLPDLSNGPVPLIAI